MTSNKKYFICLAAFVCILLAANLNFFKNQPAKIHTKPLSATNTFVDIGYVIIKTREFMAKGVEETDPDLILFVRSLIHPPSTHAYNFTSPRHANIDYSQEGQSSFIDGLLQKKTNGFFIEAGAYDGEAISNSLFFELTRQWTGLLIEPVFFDQVKSKCRKAFAINACIANNKPMVAKFLIGRGLSGRSDIMTEHHKNRIKAVNAQDVYLYVPCFSLVTIMKALEVDKVDYFSLDVEGGEMDVLNSINLNELDVKTFSIEHNSRRKDIHAIRNYFKSRVNYKEMKIDGQDIFFQKFPTD